MQLEISVVIPTYNRPDRLPGLLATLERQTLALDRFEVVIVDNGSTEETFEVLTKLAVASPLQLRPLRIEVNDGPAAARNLGWREAHADIVALTDDDVFCDPGWLEAGLAAMSADPMIGVAQGATQAPDGAVLGELPEWALWRVIDKPSPYFEGCNLFFRREALLETGGFDEEIGWWGEDTSTGWRIVDAGWGRGFFPEARVEHPIEFRGVKYYVRNGYLEKNLVVLAKRHRGFREEAFWRPWAFRKRDALLAAAVVSVAGSLVWRPAILGVLPYLRGIYPMAPSDNRVRQLGEVIAVDAARVAGHLRGSLEGRTFAL